MKLRYITKNTLRQAALSAGRWHNFLPDLNPEAAGDYNGFGDTHGPPLTKTQYHRSAQAFRTPTVFGAGCNRQLCRHIEHEQRRVADEIRRDLGANNETR